MTYELRTVIASWSQRFTLHSMICYSDRITLWTGNELPKSIARPSRLQSSMLLKVRTDRPSLSESLIKSIDHTWLISVGTASALGLSLLRRDFGFSLKLSSSSRYKLYRRLWFQLCPLVLRKKSKYRPKPQRLCVVVRRFSQPSTSEFSSISVGL